jgi:REP element-mobilizing transposase RayT
MVRGIERRALFREERDRADFVDRVAALAEGKGWTVVAWALLPTHAHLLVRTGHRPLAAAMRSLLTGYAGAFNRRHQRHGHLFQNRYKSIVVEEDPYLLEVARYIHLNPVRAGLVRDLPALDRYRWTGHSAVLGRRPRPWQAVEEILGHFGRKVGPARVRYRAFVAAGLRQGRRPDLEGGGLKRSAGGWEGLRALRRGRERWAFDERVLGSGAFVERLRAAATLPRPRPARALQALPRVIARVAQAFGLPPAALTSGTRARPVVQARAAVSAVAVPLLGLPATQVAAALGVTQMPVLRGLARGRTLLAARGLDPERLARGAMR